MPVTPEAQPDTAVKRKVLQLQVEILVDRGREHDVALSLCTGLGRKASSDTLPGFHLLLDIAVSSADAAYLM